MAVDKYMIKKQSEQLAKKTPFRMEKMPLPKFDGSIRKYPQFKKDFHELILPSINSKEASYTLRQCFSKEVDEYVGSCNDDVMLMFKRLDVKYGDASKIVESIMSEIVSYKRTDDDEYEKIVRFIDMIEIAHRDLSQMKLEKELSNTNTTSIIEGKLPKVMQMEWYRYMHKPDSSVDKNDKFPALLEFLRAERDAIEYGLSDLRKNQKKSSSSTVNAFNTKASSANSTLPSITQSDQSSPCVIHFWSENHGTEDCRTFKNLSIEKKIDVLKEKSCCFGCLSSKHVMADCTHKIKCVADENCNEFHHPCLHMGKKDGNATAIFDNNTTQVLLPAMSIPCDSKKCNQLLCLWDSCADVSLITNSKAQEMRLQPKPVKLSITVAGGEKLIIDSCSYQLRLFDRKRQIHTVTVFGIDRITNPVPEIKPDSITEQFPDINIHDVIRPSGDVDILIGSDYAGWQPDKERESGHLVILNNIFGKCVAGRFSTVRECPDRAAVNLVKTDSLCNEFLTVESLGVQCQPKCGNCKCGTCPIGGKPFNLREERELNQIEQGLEYAGTHWTASLPWIKDPNNLPDTKDYALKRFYADERRREKDPCWNKSYCEQMEEMIKHGFARKLSLKELEDWKGPSHYICHHAVENPASKSTPVRIVWDSRQVNEFMAKGPDAYMNNLLDVILRFREHRHGFVGDVRKMFNSVRMNPADQHTHWFFWRNNKTSLPEVYVITVVNMGDRPSGTIATVALHKTAQISEHQFPQEADIIINSSYMDDISDSVDGREDAHELTKTISSILSKGNFRIKEWIISGSGNGETQKILGLPWQPCEDLLNVAGRVNLSRKVRNNRSGPDLSIHDLENGPAPPLSKRKTMSVLNSIFDPCGLSAPVVVRGKILLRDLWNKDISWDTVLDQSDTEQWIAFFKEMCQMCKINFNRSIKPENTCDKQPILVTFSDASTQAFGACAYVRWEMTDGTFRSRLLLAKSRVAPLKVATVARLELSAAVMAKRLRTTVEDVFRTTFERVIHIVDSQIVKAQIKSESHGFKTFVATRIGEIQTTTNADEWYWIDSSSNIADIITRGASACDLGGESEWQNGPDFMKLPVEDWPINQDIDDDVIHEVPDLIARVSWITMTSKIPIDIERFSRYMKLLRVTALVLQVKELHSFRIRLPLNPVMLTEAMIWWVKDAQETIKAELVKGEKGKGSYRKLNVKNVEGVFVARGRLEMWSETNYSTKDLAILPAKHRISELYARYIHEEAHRGVRADIAKIRSEYWITGIHRLVSRIRYNCVPCRRLDRKLQEQVMAPLPPERLNPAPVWHYTALDLFGPFPIKGEVNKRSSGKGYGVIFTCLLTRAVFVDIACDYSTDGFLLVFRRFVCIRGYPAKIFSDPGSQLTPVPRELKEMFNEFDWDRIRDITANHGLEWKFTPPEGPWYNGCCEALVRSVKKCIQHAIGPNRLTFTEIQTVFYECANVVNERPIGTTPSSVQDGTYLSPNDILLGRATNKVPTGDFNLTINSRRRLYFVQRLTDSFWKKWIRDYFHTLRERKVWHDNQRNVQIDDVVIIKDRDAKRSKWKLGVITAAIPGSDGKVRRVRVRYINPSGTPAEFERPIQNVVVLL